MSLQDDLITDLAAFFNTDEFAVEAQYRPEGNLTWLTINVIFEQEDLSEMGMEASRYYCEAKTSDVQNAVPGELMTIDGVRYKIKNPPRHTQTGISIMELTID